MITRCPFTGLYYGDDYSVAHPDAAIVGCDCWAALHPDGRGGYVMDDEKFQRASDEHMEFHRGNGAVEVVLEDCTETLLEYRERIERIVPSLDGEKPGWRTRPLSEPVGDVYRLEKALREVKSQINVLTEEGSWRRQEILELESRTPAEP